MLNLQNIHTISALENYLRDLKSNHGDEAYDFNGLLHLVLALFDNLSKNALDQELIEAGCFFNDDQRKFLLTLAQYISDFNDEDCE